jgi:hypothetical protein
LLSLADFAETSISSSISWCGICLLEKFLMDLFDFKSRAIALGVTMVRPMDSKPSIDIRWWYTAPVEQTATQCPHRIHPFSMATDGPSSFMNTSTFSGHTSAHAPHIEHLFSSNEINVMRDILVLRNEYGENIISQQIRHITE